MTEWSVWKESTEGARIYICLFLRPRDKQSVFNGDSGDSGKTYSGWVWIWDKRRILETKFNIMKKKEVWCWILEKSYLLLSYVLGYLSSNNIKHIV